jgi:hypothetical protein
MRNLFFTPETMVITSAAEFSIYYVKIFTAADYARAYWTIAALESALGIAALCELVDCRVAGIFLGITAGVALHWCASIAGFRGVSGILALAAMPTAFTGPREKRGIAAGFVVLYLFPAILYLPSVPYWTRFIPVLAWLVAELLWISEILPSARGNLLTPSTLN